MKLNIFLFSALLLASACSKNDSSGTKTRAEGEKSEVIQFEALTIRTTSVDGVNTVPVSNLDFATLAPGQSATQDLIVSNGLASALTIPAGGVVASDIAPFTMVDGCNNTVVLKSRTCKITFSLKNIASPTETVLTKSITINGAEITLTATLAADLTPPNSPVANISVAPTQIDFGSLKAGVTKEMSVVVTNRGTVAQTIAAPIISNPKITISSNTCGSLLKSRTCSIKFKYTPVEDETQAVVQFSSVANNAMTYSVVVASPTSSEPEILAVAPLVLSSSETLTEPAVKSGTLIFSNTGTVALASPVVGVSSHPGISVTAVSCSGGLARARTCSVSYSVNSALLPSGASTQSIKLQSGTMASLSHSIELNITKLGVACTVQDAMENGVVVTNSNSSIKGIRTQSDFSACLLADAACDSYYLRNESGKSCDAKACAELSSAELMSLEYVLANATISGTYPECSVACSDSFQQLASDSKSCVDKAPFGAISFSSDFTKETSGNTLSINAVDGKKIEFYSDDSCGTVISSLDLPLTSTSMNLSSGDGVKHVYARVVNGQAWTNCLSDSIILDQTGPSLAITSPENGSTFESNSVVVTGTCSDNYTSNLTVTGDLAGDLQSAVCSNGAYEMTFNTSNIGAGSSPAVVINSSDDLGNSSMAIIAITKIAPAYDDVIATPSYSSLYMFAQAEETNPKGMELYSIDSNYSISLEKDLLNFGFGYISSSYSSSIPAFVKLADNKMYVNGGVVNSTVTNGAFGTANVALRINPGEVNATAMTEVGYQPNSLYYSTALGKHLYRNSLENMIKSVDQNGTVLEVTFSQGTTFSPVEMSGRTYFTTVDNSGANAISAVKSIGADGIVVTEASTIASTLFTATPLVVLKNKLYSLMNTASSGYKLFLVNQTTDTFDLVPFNSSITSHTQVNYSNVGYPTVVVNPLNAAQAVMVFNCAVVPAAPASQTSQNEFCIYDGVNPFGVINIATTAVGTSSAPTGFYVYNGMVVFKALVNTIPLTQQGTEFVVYNPGNYTDLYNINKIIVVDLSTTALSASSQPGSFSTQTVNGNQRLMFAASNGTLNDFYTWDGVFPFQITKYNVPSASLYPGSGTSYAVSGNQLFYSNLVDGTTSEYEVARCNLAACNLTSTGRYFQIMATLGNGWGSITAPDKRQFIVNGDYVYFQAYSQAHGTTHYPMKIFRLRVSDLSSFPEVVNEYNSSWGRGATNWMAYLDGELFYHGNDYGPFNFQQNSFTDLFKYSLSSEEELSFDLSNGIQSSVLTGSASNIGIGSNSGVVYGNRIYLNGTLDDNKGQELLVTDGFNTPINLDLNPGAPGSNPVNLKVRKLKEPVSGETREVLFFTANGGAGLRTWMIDGNSNPLNLGPEGIFYTSYKGKVYFMGTEAATGRELWETDGTVEGTKIVMDLNPGAPSSITAYFHSYDPNYTQIHTVILDSTYKMCFMATSPATGLELFCHDGESLAAVEINPGAGNGGGNGQAPLFAFQNKLYFTGSATGTTVNNRMYSYNGSSAPSIVSVNYPSIADSVAVFAEKVYYPCATSTATSDYELCVFDGVNSVRYDLNVGASASSPRNFIKFKDRLYFNFTSATDTTGLLLKYLDTTDATSQIFPAVTSGGLNILNSYSGTTNIKYIYRPDDN